MCGEADGGVDVVVEVEVVGKSQTEVAEGRARKEALMIKRAWPAKTRTGHIEPVCQSPSYTPGFSAPAVDAPSFDCLCYLERCLTLFHGSAL